MANSPEMEGGGLVRMTLYCEGEAIPGVLEVISVTVRKAVNRIPVAEIVVRDGDMPDQSFQVSDAAYFKPGAAIKINAGYDASEATIFEGIVIRHGIKISSDNYSRLVVECRDKAVAMTVGRKNANYVDS